MTLFRTADHHSFTAFHCFRIVLRDSTAEKDDISYFFSTLAIAAIRFRRVTMPHNAFLASTTGTKFWRSAASTTTEKSASIGSFLILQICFAGFQYMLQEISFCNASYIAAFCVQDWYGGKAAAGQNL